MRVQKDNLRYTEYSELENFLISYFGDYWEGKTEKEILKEALKESSGVYFYRVIELIEKFLLASIPINDKNKFIQTCVFHQIINNPIMWLEKIKLIMQQLITKNP